jgi:hypothetical protein
MRHSIRGIHGKYIPERYSQNEEISEYEHNQGDKFKIKPWMIIGAVSAIGLFWYLKNKQKQPGLLTQAGQKVGVSHGSPS